MPLTLGQPAPDFALSDQDGTTHTRQDFAGKWLVLYFYPKAMTPGCTVQAQHARDAQADFASLNAAIVGVSADEPAKLKKFQDKEGLNFTLLGDPTHAMLEAYGMWVEKSMYGKTYWGVSRSTVILDPQGIVRHVIPKASPKTHHTDVIEWLKTHGR